jgi:PAS domain S-box-containing protein
MAVLQLLASQAAISLENAHLYTDLEQAKEKARQSARELRLALDSIRALAWSAAPDGSSEVFNKQWHDFTGLSPAEADSGGWQASYHHEDLGKVVDKWRQILAAGQTGEVEARMRRFDGIYRRFLIRGTPLRDESRHIIRWYGTNTDIEDLKRAEEELRLRETDLRKAQAELAHVTRVTTMGELAASIAHEVSQPIAGVLLNGTSSLRWLARINEDPASLGEVRESLLRIVRDGNRASEVIARIRTLFKKGGNPEGAG